MTIYRSLYAILASACLILSVAGCGAAGGASGVVGAWAGKASMEGVQAGVNIPAKTLDYLLTCNVTFNADKTFEARLAQTGIKGKWEMQGDKVKMTMEQMMLGGGQGADIKAVKATMEKNAAARHKKADTSMLDRPYIGTFSADGKTLTLDHGTTNYPGPVVLTRAN